MKRMLVVSTQLMKTGGIESHLAQFVTAASSFASIDVLSLNTECPATAKRTYADAPGRRWFFRSGPGAARMWVLLRALLIIRSGRYAAIYTNGQGGSIVKMSMVRSPKCRWVHHHHTAGDLEDQNTWPVSYREAMQKCDRLIACSTRNAGWIAEAIGRTPEVVPCFSRAVPALRSPATGRRLRFGYFGRLIPEKGIAQMIRLAEDPATSDIEFHIWGHGSAYSAWDFANRERLHFHGAFDGGAALGEVLSTLDAYLLLSTHPEGLPIALLECLGAGLPWIATDRGGIPDIACDPHATTVLPASPTYEECIAATLGLAEKIRSGSVHAGQLRALYDSRFSSEALTTEWKNVLLG